jgi:hypothetical protein
MLMKGAEGAETFRQGHDNGRTARIHDREAVAFHNFEQFGLSRLCIRVPDDYAGITVEDQFL